MKVKLIVCFCVLSGLANVTTAAADPIRLAAFSTTYGLINSAVISINLPPTTPTVFGFGLALSRPQECSITTHLYATGVFVCDRTSAASFDLLATMLTDSISQDMGVTGSLPTFGASVGVGRAERDMFGGLLTGRSIDHLRLEVHANDIRVGPVGPSLVWYQDVTWEVWGTGDPLPSAVITAEPSTLVQLAFAGLLSLKARKLIKLKRKSL